jgi:hypothetical protein
MHTWIQLSNTLPYPLIPPYIFNLMIELNGKYVHTTIYVSLLSVCLFSDFFTYVNSFGFD